MKRMAMTSRARLCWTIPWMNHKSWKWFQHLNKLATSAESSPCKTPWKWKKRNAITHIFKGTVDLKQMEHKKTSFRTDWPKITWAPHWPGWILHNRKCSCIWKLLGPAFGSWWHPGGCCQRRSRRRRNHPWLQQWSALMAGFGSHIHFPFMLYFVYSFQNQNKEKTSQIHTVD